MGLGIFIIAAGAYIAFITKDNKRQWSAVQWSAVQGRLVAAVFIGAGIAIAVQDALM